MLPRILKSDAEVRKYQINTLMIFNDNVREIFEGAEYEVSFVAGCNNFTLKILLSRDFPNEKPTLKIYPVVHHLWVDNDGVITSAPGLLSFNPVSSDLGRVVQVIIREFQRDPPPLMTNAVKPSTSLIKAISDCDLAQKVYDVFKTLCKTALKSAHNTVLKSIDENPDRIAEIVDSCPSIKKQTMHAEELAAAVEELAESNISKKEALEQLRNDVDQAIEEVTKLVLENEQLLATYQSLSDRYAPRKIQEELRKAAGKAEEESEKIAESFLSGSMDVDKFVSNFISARTLSHNRKIKEEKLGQQLDKLERAGF